MVSICACAVFVCDGRVSLWSAAYVLTGSVIRAIRRIEEVLRQFATACKIIGNAELAAKFDEGIKKIKRDVVFSASLFL